MMKYLLIYLFICCDHLIEKLKVITDNLLKLKKLSENFIDFKSIFILLVIMSVSVFNHVEIL